MTELEPIKILVVDDITANLDLLQGPLEQAGYRFLAAREGEVALKIAQHAHPDLILLDVLLPDMDGYEVCRRLKADPTLAEIPVIFITARDESEGVVEGFAAGGVDYIVKPFRQEEVLARVATHVQINHLTRDLRQKTVELEREIQERQSLTHERNKLVGHISQLAQQEANRWGIAAFIGQSQTLQSILASVGKVQGADSTRVLITGESGTGKELVARAIHSGSSRANGPFVTVNCAALPTELAESILFGHRQGFFTGADKDHLGHFELAHQGTLFLDEIGDMPLAIQGKILRVLEDGAIQPLGESDTRVVDLRVLAATNVDLQQAAETGAFRRDLYFRLAQYIVQVPPLRQRKEDIPLLADHFLHLFAEEMGTKSPGLSADGLAALEGYDFPGNVRELKNIVERALIESAGDEIKRQHLYFAQSTAPQVASPLPDDEFPDDLQEVTYIFIKRMLVRTDGNITAAAQRLGIHRSSIYRIMAQHDPDFDKP